ncbi:MAG: C25 family cysteine peptidase, partial [Actinomycetes bacterium]
FNDRTSNEAYVLRVRQADSPGVPTCPAYTRTGGVPGSLPDLGVGTSSSRTLILVNTKRLGDTYGTSQVSTVLSRLATYAARSEVKGIIFPVESDAQVLAAYNLWNANPCANTSANAVVKAISGIVNGVKKGTYPGSVAHPALENVVVVGGDDIIPLARLDDTTWMGNEAEYADTFEKNNAYYSSPADSRFFSDDPYGDLDPVKWGNRSLFVPDLSLGRLVEEPTQIVGQIDQYLASNGRLDPSTGYSAGADFMVDGASSVREALTKSLTSAGEGPTASVGGPASPDAWSASDLLTGVAGKKVAAVFGHAEHTRFEAANFSTFTSTELAAQFPTGSRLVFSMGCHSGLAVSNRTVPLTSNNADLAEQMAGKGAAYVATTGYGFGDGVTVGLQERLMTLFSQGLDGSRTLGDAMASAKQQYFATQGLYGAYDEKSLSSMTVYGLPTYSLGVGKPAPAAPPSKPTAAVVGNPSLRTQSFGTSSTFAPRAGSSGSWYEVVTAAGAQSPLAVAARPLQPRFDVDVTAADPSTGSLLPAHGAVVTSLLSDSFGPVDAAFNRPVLDRADGEAERPNQVKAFPVRLANVTTFSDRGGLPTASGVPKRQKLVLTPGQFFDDGEADAAGNGFQALYGKMNGEVFHSTSNDWTPPRVTAVRTSTLTAAPANTVRFEVTANDSGNPGDIQRVVALYRDGFDWKSNELVSNGTSWVGARLLTGGSGPGLVVVYQVVDKAGNVAVTSDKGPGYVPQPDGQGDDIAPVGVAQTFPAPGLGGPAFTQPVTVELRGNDGGGSGVVGITYSISGAQATPATAVQGSVARLQITTPGTSTISYRVTDAFNNQSALQSITITYTP